MLTARLMSSLQLHTLMLLMVFRPTTLACICIHTLLSFCMYADDVRIPVPGANGYRSHTEEKWRKLVTMEIPDLHKPCLDGTVPTRKHHQCPSTLYHT